MLPGPVLYVSGEESVTQVADRATRLAAEPSLPAPPPDLMLLSATSMDSILQQAAALRPRAMVVDSIQTVFLGGVGGSAGSVQQVRECSAALLRLAKELGCPVFVVGHVTKVCAYCLGITASDHIIQHHNMCGYTMCYINNACANHVLCAIKHAHILSSLNTTRRGTLRGRAF